MSDAHRASESKPQTPPQTGAEAPLPVVVRPRRRGKMLVGVVVLTAMALGVAGYWFFFMRGIVYSDDARLAGHLVDVAPEITGRIIFVPVQAGQFVRRGDLIFALDPATQQAAIGQAQAALESAQATLSASQARYEKACNGSRPEEIKAQEAVVKRLENEEQLAQRELGRMETVRQHGAATHDEFDRSEAGLESAKRCRETAAQNLLLLQQGSRKEDIAAAKADVALARSRSLEAQAALDRSRTDLARCSVRSPFDGWVVRRWLDPGAMPLPGQPVVSLFDPATLRVDANIEEKYLGGVAVGDAVDIAVDAYPDLRLQGRVKEILRATNSQFSLIPAEGVSGTFIKVTQRVPLRIALTAPPELYLGPGLSVEVRIRRGSSDHRQVRGPGRD